MNNEKATTTEGGKDNALAILLGAFELLVLLAVIDSSPYSYGITIRDAATRRRHHGEEDGPQRRISLGAIYATLDRLQAKGLVHSWRGDPTPARGGRSKRFFELTPRGEASVHRSLNVMRMPAALAATT
ncbi:MAG: PadR family transcriptional regulator [Acidobacteria bacterium]|nr:PadR family transcriptional regulator [Acidobacteriota bacterium]MBV9069929.1 PadR family transcriptional regulator [Acidobacteriota bacterium]MBV9185834.1 PadR family transcriptional regulator [Acidobacteriota bacterium]